MCLLDFGLNRHTECAYVVEMITGWDGWDFDAGSVAVHFMSMYTHTCGTVQCVFNEGKIEHDLIKDARWLHSEKINFHCAWTVLFFFSVILCVYMCTFCQEVMIFIATTLLVHIFYVIQS